MHVFFFWRSLNSETKCYIGIIYWYTYWCIGTLVLLVYWYIGLLVYWYIGIGILVYWYIGILVHVYILVHWYSYWYIGILVLVYILADQSANLPTGFCFRQFGILVLTKLSMSECSTSLKIGKLGELVMSLSFSQNSKAKMRFLEWPLLFTHSQRASEAAEARQVGLLQMSDCQGE